MNATHKALRAGTAEAHDRVDRAFAGFDLTDRQSYAAFLRAHAEVVLPLEAALPGVQITPDWEERKRGALLREDLAFLRHPGESRDLVQQAASFAPGDPGFRGVDGKWDEAAIAGALYVLEGSRLGGRFLARQVPPSFPRAYLDADQPPEKWRNLLDRFDTILYQPAQLQSALAAAHTVFAAFERSAQRWAKG
ncbi:biliverdin-producing heme oxygenase [Sphingomonas sp. DG1-23]|uniref:biliverdin-producing heme oxygenase n=1 Tax=Sphingomonas sp. DG1-23 TaxID=3068316 RepID=UPI00273F5B99|nr:biliverdin-producing heme oxygenase [Sphingomonas sp. DG1-23]MDP5278796.1 biliverdin-producing heme oxygenase [Sphingomonas sp. DG1-23]